MLDNDKYRSRQADTCQFRRVMLICRGMKKNIHPKYYPEAKIICACGNVITTGSVKPEMKVEVCSACHPFYTGKKRLVDTAGRLERFKKRMEKSEQIIAKKIKSKTEKKKPGAAQKTEKAPKAKKAAPKKAKTTKTAKAKK